MKNTKDDKKMKQQPVFSTPKEMEFFSESTIGSFFRVNWIIFVIVMPMFLISGIYFDSKSTDMMEEILIEVRKNSDYVITTRMDGVPNRIQKTKLDIDSTLFVSYLLQEGRRYVIDKELVTDGYSQKLNDVMDIFTYAEDLKYGINHFFPKADDEKLDPVYVKNYASPIYQQYRLHQLPASIKVLKTLNYTYSPNVVDSSFVMSIEYEVLVTVLDIETNKFKKFKSVANIDMDGVFNPYDLSTIENPYGLVLKINATLPYSNPNKTINK